MKKTTYINLSGMAFKIEEDAFEKLNSYLDSVKSRLGESDEATETLNDIESRMAELFSSVVSSSDKSITIGDVDEVIKILGNPEDYEPDDDSTNIKDKKANHAWKSRRLFRDSHNRVFGGVCSGLGAYFNIDPIVFRLLFILGLFYGISIIPYIVLWIIIPKALTIEQRAQMTSGYNSDSLRRKASSYNNYGEPAPAARAVQALKTALGIVIIVCSVAIMFAFTITFFVSKIGFGSGSHIGWVREIVNLFINPVSSIYALLGVALVVGIPVIMIFYAGLQLVFSFKRGGKIIGLAGFVLWLSGIALIVYAGVGVGKQFRERTIVSQTEVLTPVESDTIFLKPTTMTASNKGKQLFRMKRLTGNLSDKHTVNENRSTTYINKRLTVEGRPVIYVINDADKFAITIERESRGESVEDAELTASKIEYFWIQKDDELFLDRIFTLSEGVPVRGQDVVIRLEIPTGKVLEIEPAIDVLVRN